MDSVGKDEKMLKEYMRNHLEEDYTSNQISLKIFQDPFKGEKREYGKNKQPLEAAACNIDAIKNFGILLRNSKY